MSGRARRRGAGSNRDIALAVHLDPAKIESFCRRWYVAELSVFGSALRDDFGPDSDVDVLVSFTPEAQRSLWDLVYMGDELTELFGRKVDLVTEPALKNPFRRDRILKTRQVVYPPCGS